jgi:hypothetical protein
MTYTAEKPSLTPPSEELRARSPRWGVDLDPADRPSVPRERLDLETGAHWDFPERQPEKWPRERSNEHKFLTPVFGTSLLHQHSTPSSSPARGWRPSASPISA